MRRQIPSLASVMEFVMAVTVVTAVYQELTPCVTWGQTAVAPGSWTEAVAFK